MAQCEVIYYSTHLSLCYHYPSYILVISIDALHYLLHRLPNVIYSLSLLLMLVA